MGQKQKTEKKERGERERLNDGNNNGQATHGACMQHACRTHTAWAKKREEERPNDGNDNGQLCIATPPWVAHAKPPGPIVSGSLPVWPKVAVASLAGPC